MKNLSTNKNFWLVVLLPLVLWACGGTNAEKSEDKPKPNKAVSVEIYKLQGSSSTALPIRTSGVLSAKTQTKLSFKVGGIIAGVYANEGQSVRTGQLLATLEQAEINAQVSQAKNALDKASRDFTRAENLYKDTVATLEQVQNARTAKDVAKANLRIASYNQSRSAIYAPTSGKILKKMAEAQELVSPGSPVYILASTAQAQVIKVGLTDKDIVKVRMGDVADVRFDAYEGEVFKARVTEIAETSDPRTGTFEVELSLDANDKILKNGFVGKVEIFPSQGQTYYKLPLSALVEADQKTAYIFVPNTKNNTVKKIALRIQGIANDYFTVAKSELKGIKAIVTDGAGYLDANSKIKVANR